MDLIKDSAAFTFQAPDGPVYPSPPETSTESTQAPPATMDGHKSLTRNQAMEGRPSKRTKRADSETWSAMSINTSVDDHDATQNTVAELEETRAGFTTVDEPIGKTLAALEEEPITTLSKPNFIASLGLSGPRAQKQTFDASADFISLADFSVQDEVAAPRPTISSISANTGFSAFGKRKRADGPTVSHNQPPWTVPRNATATPWSTGTPTPKDAVLQLHKDVCEFYAFVKPLNHENTVRVNILNRVTNTVEKRYPGSRLRCFGSFATGLYLPDGDMDVVLLSNNFILGRGSFNWKREMYTLMNHLVQCGIAENQTYAVIKRARVPILKFIECQTGVQIDMSFDNDGGVRAVETIVDWKRLYPDMPVLVAIVKQFLLMRGLNEVVNGGLGGFSVICLVVHFLRQHPLDGLTTKRRGHLGKLLLEFFDFYGNTFDYNNVGIDMHSGAFRKDQPNKKWMIMNPHDRNHDISSGTTKAPMIVTCFSEAHALLKQQMKLFDMANMDDRRSNGILGVILGANYQSYKDKRSILRSVHGRLTAGEDFIARLVSAFTIPLTLCHRQFNSQSLTLHG